jgi:ubiquinone/menaquinone biosynthesis C-methylase UbiE
MQKDLFGFQTQGINYELYRPKYPTSMLNKVIGQIKGKNRYLDIATGTGQILFQMCNNFEYSQGLDISQNMLSVC